MSSAAFAEFGVARIAAKAINEAARNILGKCVEGRENGVVAPMSFAAILSTSPTTMKPASSSPAIWNSSGPTFSLLFGESAAPTACADSAPIGASLRDRDELPYYVSGALFTSLSEHWRSPTHTVVTLVLGSRRRQRRPPVSRKRSFCSSDRCDARHRTASVILAAAVVGRSPLLLDRAERDCWKTHIADWRPRTRRRFRLYWRAHKNQGVAASAISVCLLLNPVRLGFSDGSRHLTGFKAWEAPAMSA